MEGEGGTLRGKDEEEEEDEEAAGAEDIKEYGKTINSIILIRPEIEENIR